MRISNARFLCASPRQQCDSSTFGKNLVFENCSKLTLELILRCSTAFCASDPIPVTCISGLPSCPSNPLLGTGSVYLKINSLCWIGEKWASPKYDFTLKFTLCFKKFAMKYTIVKSRVRFEVFALKSFVSVSKLEKEKS